jgi:hypothetical protein
MNIAINKTPAFIATNNSGVNLPFGALVVVNNALESFTTTTTLGFSNGIVGVILEKNGIANGQAVLHRILIWSGRITWQAKACHMPHHVCKAILQ